MNRLPTVHRVLRYPSLGRCRLVSAASLALVLCLVGTAPIPSAASDRRTVFDPLGRKVAVPADPGRIVALAPSITEMVFALGRESRLVGATRFADHPPEAQRLPRVGSYVHLDLERIVALNPDLCIAIKDGNPKAVIDRLSAFDIPVYAVDPRGLSSVMETLSRLGTLLNARERADRLVGDMASRIRRVDRQVASVAERPTVFFQIGITPIVSAGADTFIHELIERAGGVNLAAETTGYPRFSEEQVLTMAPEVIIVTTMSREAGSREAMDRWSRWSRLPAVKNERLFLVDSNLFDRPTPRLVDALELLVRLIHPQEASR